MGDDHEALRADREVGHAETPTGSLPVGVSVLD